MSDTFIFKQLAKVSQGLKAVKMKNMQRFKARNIYDVYNMVQPLMAEHGIIISRKLMNEDVTHVTSKTGTKGHHRVQLWEFTFYAEDGSTFVTQCPGESLDFGDKSSSQVDAMVHKQLLLHTFMIPTEQKDPDDGPEKTAQAEQPEQEPCTPVGGNGGTVSPAQIKRLWAISISRELSKKQVEKSIFDRYGFDSASKLNKSQYDEFVGVMEAMPDKSKVKNHAPS